MAKLQSTEIVGVANRPATICSNTMCIWFDTTNLKTVISYVLGTSWSAGGAMITARLSLAGAGSQNEGLAFAGYGGTNCTEEYNGTSWSVGGALITARRASASGGVQNEAFAAGGFTSVGVSNTEEYNGTSWSTGGVLITGRQIGAGTGTQGAGLIAGGYSNANVSCTEEYLKSSYTIVDCIL